jgi:hypothetical protein
VRGASERVGCAHVRDTAGDDRCVVFNCVRSLAHSHTDNVVSLDDNDDDIVRDDDAETLRRVIAPAVVFVNKTCALVRCVCVCVLAVIITL